MNEHEHMYIVQDNIKYGCSIQYIYIHSTCTEHSIIICIKQFSKLNQYKHNNKRNYYFLWDVYQLEK